ncbi:hypothetical protein COR50_20360 [Chitinophaga caeni]|uniref:DUF4890 domain-containing protein n=1 Tax=Chitinophaga caeni TaxID=2029983 RepID=A0A291QZ88_9BACT|nr:hypothetical protein [Chitinophaga caeni]ATL49339.1 hypothetical protein COR50_20360 [Chitinophaga caeni]
MKKMFVMVFACLLVGMTAFAQQGPGGQRRSVEDRVKMTMEWMNKELSLTADQNTKITAIQTDFYKSMDKMRESGERPDRETFKKMNDEKEAKIKEVLTEEQYKTYTAKLEEMRKRRGGMRPRGGGGRKS